MIGFRWLKSISTEPYMLIGSMIFSIHQMTLTQLLMTNGCHLKFNRTTCRNLDQNLDVESKVQQNGAIWMAIITSTSYIVGLIATMILGTMADKYKKTRLMLLTPVFSAGQSVTYFAISYFKQPFSPALLLLGAFMSGIYGELQGIIMLAASFIASHTKDESRTLRFNMLAVSIYFGFILSGVPTGFLLRSFGYPSVFLFTLSLNLLDLLYIRLFLWQQESDKSTTLMGSETSSSKLIISDSSFLLSHTQCNTFEHFKQAGDAFRSLFRRPIRLRMMILMLVFCLALANIVPETIIQVFYLKRSPFDFNAVEIGELITLQNVIRGISASVINILLTVKLKIPDVWIVSFCFFSQVLYFLSMGLTRSRISVLPLQLLGVGLPLTAPSLRAMISKLVSAERQGVAMAAVQILDTSAGLISTVALNLVYAKSVRVNPALAFFIFTGAAILCLLLMLIYHFVDLCKKRMMEGEHKYLINEEGV